MLNRRSLGAAAAVLVAALAAPPARAEVAAESDAYGRYVRTTILTQTTISGVKVWKVMRRGLPGVVALNPEGDRVGDQLPAIAENPAEQRRPVAVWSRFDGSGADLVWARWLPWGAWSPIVPVVFPGLAGDDLHPQVRFDQGGRGFLAWWNVLDGVGQVYAAVLESTGRWSQPLRLSDPAVDSRSPTLTTLADGRAQVVFQTPFGDAIRILYWAEPTIVDDLNPVGATPSKQLGPGGP